MYRLTQSYILLTSLYCCDVVVWRYGGPFAGLLSGNETETPSSPYPHVATCVKLAPRLIQNIKMTLLFVCARFVLVCAVKIIVCAGKDFE